MTFLRRAVRSLSSHARKRRAQAFRSAFVLSQDTKILDLGSEDGSNIRSVLNGTSVRPENVHIADIDSSLVQKGHNLFGFVPLFLYESDTLPFPDGYFDIVYCSSVIEHVTVSKSIVWTVYDGTQFKRESLVRQHRFAAEIRRVGKQYFVQTPSKSFPIESHSWLPFAGYLPRPLLLPVLRLSNRIWIKETSPDWNLLGCNDFAAMFCDAEIVAEKYLGITKSIMAIKSNGRPGQPPA